MSRKARSNAAERRAYAPVFAALGDETRLALVSRLSEGEACSIAQLTEGTQLTRQAVTKHLRVLTNARIVRSVKSGRENPVRARPRTAARSARLRRGGVGAVGIARLAG